MSKPVVAFPVYILAKDCGDVMEFPSRSAMQGYLEATDVENNEYEAWDRDGNVLCLSVAKPKTTWLNIVTTLDRVSEEEFAALKDRARAHAN